MAQGRSTRIISMIKWIRTSRMSIEKSLSLQYRGEVEGLKSTKEGFRVTDEGWREIQRRGGGYQKEMDGEVPGRSRESTEAKWRGCRVPMHGGGYRRELAGYREEAEANDRGKVEGALKEGEV